MAESPPVLGKRHPLNAPNRSLPRAADRGANRDIAARLHEAVGVAGGNTAVARRSGVPLATVNNYVRGRNGMKIGPLAALAAACNVSLDWIISGREAATTARAPDPGIAISVAGPPPVPDFQIPIAGPPPVPDLPIPVAALPPGLREAQAELSPAGIARGIDVRVLAKAIEIVAALAGAADLIEDPKGFARRIATTYAVLTETDASHE